MSWWALGIGVVCMLASAYFLEYDTPLGDAAGIPLGIVGMFLIIGSVVLV